MSVRNHLLSELTRNLLGPRYGAAESISENPRSRYVTGILAPQSEVELPRSIDDDLDLPEGDVDDAYSDDEGEMDAAPALSGAPALDPKSLPRSLGISFLTQGPEDGPVTIRLCATWARYIDDGGQFVRRPMACVTPFVDLSDEWRLNGPDDITLHVRRTDLPIGVRRYSVFLINARGVTGDHPATDDFVFQPQIRVLLGDGVQLAAMAHGGGTDADEESMRLLYRRRTALARGHLCSAVWREIDPERPASGLVGDSPFEWVDRDSVSAEDRAAFSGPDLRTEYVPVYPVMAPSPDWDADRGAAPELDAGELARRCSAGELEAALRPIATAYERWIAGLRGEVPSLPQDLQAVALRHIADCSSACQRINRAIDLLERDADVRLAFCLANQAIHLQYHWRGVQFAWRPFQMAFMLLALPGIADDGDHDRGVCDLLWFPTGGGKTEAYLGLVAFTLALRRLRAPRGAGGDPEPTGLGVLSRYTLRLLTIQQFRRALGLITACEVLRVTPDATGRVGWRPEGCDRDEDNLWGVEAFTLGVWAGRNVTPNGLRSLIRRGRPPVHGALEILLGQSGEGEPAQVLECPCCLTSLALAQPRLAGQERPAFPAGSELRLHLVFFSDVRPAASPRLTGVPGRFDVSEEAVTAHAASQYYTLSVKLTATGVGFSAVDVDGWWGAVARPALGGLHAELACARPSRPGYFIRTFRTPRTGKEEPLDFHIYCPNPGCGLASPHVSGWRERLPLPVQRQEPAGVWQEVAEPFQSAHDATVGVRVPIPALTVDDQIYRRPPSLLIGTVDKFARLAFAPEAASLFGNVTHFERHLTSGVRSYGYTRSPSPGGTAVVVRRLPPPDLILQDELHLIDGPLGSMVGIYETAVDLLARRRDGEHVSRPKYIASTATSRSAEDQVLALFDRRLAQFPPLGLDADDSFFSRTGGEPHPATIAGAGRLYVGVAAPGKGAQTPIVRIWGQLLQSIMEPLQSGAPHAGLDPFWTLVGYFNAIRELAGAAGLYRQDIPQWVGALAAEKGVPPRSLTPEALELSSRADSLILPSLLNRLDIRLPGHAEVAALATSMFGTGVDVSRLGLMVVHGQPKTTSAYIQATGRIGRREAGLVVGFLRASRPRDLDHYEFFCGYHRQLYRAVEPVTVAPFSPRARERAVGPLCTALLRQAHEIAGVTVSSDWPPQSGALHMAGHRHDSEVAALPTVFEQRAMAQPPGRRPPPGVTAVEVDSELDRWRHLAAAPAGTLRYFEYTMDDTPTVPVVLGDPQHEINGLDVAYENAPQSLREVEATTGFKV